MIRNVAVGAKVVVVDSVIILEKRRVRLPVHVLNVHFSPVFVFIFQSVDCVLYKYLAVGTSEKRPPPACIVAELAVRVPNLVGKRLERAGQVLALPQRGRILLVCVDKVVHDVVLLVVDEVPQLASLALEVVECRDLCIQVVVVRQTLGDRLTLNGTDVFIVEDVFSLGSADADVLDLGDVPDVPDDGGGSLAEGGGEGGVGDGLAVDRVNGHAHHLLLIVLAGNVPAGCDDGAIEDCEGAGAAAGSVLGDGLAVYLEVGMATGLV